MTTTDPELTAIRERAAKATAGPWRSLRDGNQYIDDGHATHIVGASRIEELPRPFHWSPHHTDKPQVSRFLDADADFIAHAREDIPELLRRLDAAREDLVSCKAALDAAHGYRDQLEAERDELREALRDVVECRDDMLEMPRGELAKSANGRVFILQIYKDGMGWEIYTNGDDNRTVETLLDAETRLRIT